VRRIVLKTASNKMSNMRKRVMTINTFFISFAFDTFDFLLTTEAVNLLKRVQMVMHSNIVSPMSMINFSNVEFCYTKKV
jgi:hypothetical protein